MQPGVRPVRLSAARERAIADERSSCLPGQLWVGTALSADWMRPSRLGQYTRACPFERQPPITVPLRGWDDDTTTRRHDERTAPSAQARRATKGTKFTKKILESLRRIATVDGTARSAVADAGHGRRRRQRAEPPIVAGCLSDLRALCGRRVLGAEGAPVERRLVVSSCRRYPPRSGIRDPAHWS
jgi:hypothetical protein